MSAPQFDVDIHSVPGIASIWRETLGNPSICIAVLDGPVHLTHPSLLNANLTLIETPLSTVADSSIASQHGTHIASIIFAQHAGGIAGLAPQCRGLIIPIFQAGQGGGLAPCSQIDLARALLLAAENGAHIINVSGGQFASSGTAHPLLTDAVSYCLKKGILIVAAAGNDGCECLHIPAAISPVLAVGAMNHEGQPMQFSNWGEQYQLSGILAPGENILGANLGGGSIRVSGTSCATAWVSGVAGLLLSIQRKLGHQPEPLNIRDTLITSALNCVDKPIPDCRRLLAGRLNIEKALSLVKQGQSTMSDNSEPVENAKDTIQMSGFNDVNAACAVSTTPQLTTPSAAAQIAPSACGCGGGGPASIVFALGSLGFDFGSEARRDSIAQHMDEPTPESAPNPYDPRQLLEYLKNNPWDAASITWTLNIDATVIYAIRPSGPFAAEVYQRLREFLSEQVDEGVERVSIPGTIAGKASLLTGQVVPVIVPDLRGMYSWTTKELVECVVGSQPPENATELEKDNLQAKRVRIGEFLDRVYYEIRNLGVLPQERAINFAATNAFNIDRVFEATLKEDMDLDSICVERSPVCRPDSDCWDVKLKFFFPQRQVQTVCKVYRFTIDVSDTVPVTVGPVRSWFVR